jgi:hypothetical protein
LATFAAAVTHERVREAGTRSGDTHATEKREREKEQQRRGEVKREFVTAPIGDNFWEKGTMRIGRALSTNQMEKERDILD